MSSCFCEDCDWCAVGKQSCLPHVKEQVCNPPVCCRSCRGTSSSTLSANKSLRVQPAVLQPYGITMTKPCGPMQHDKAMLELKRNPSISHTLTGGQTKSPAKRSHFPIRGDMACLCTVHVSLYGNKVFFRCYK